MVRVREERKTVWARKSDNDRSNRPGRRIKLPDKASYSCTRIRGSRSIDIPGSKARFPITSNTIDTIRCSVSNKQTSLGGRNPLCIVHLGTDAQTRYSLLCSTRVVKND